MKEATGSIPLFGIAIVFVILFTSYISLSINYSRAFNIKNEIVNIIRNQGGICNSSATYTGLGEKCDNFTAQIKDFFEETNYRGRGKCEGGFFDLGANKKADGSNLDWHAFTKKGVETSGSDIAFCVAGVRMNDIEGLPITVYYKVKVFWQLDLPIFSNIFNFVIEGETNPIYDPNECNASLGIASGEWC